MSDVETILALDCGQSGSRGRVFTVEGKGAGDGSQEVLADAIALPAVRTDLGVIEQLAGFITAVAADHRLDTVALGVTGLTDSDRAEDLLRLVKGHGITRVSLAHDSVSSYLAALGAESGVVVASGTGVVTLAVGASTTARVDGWGYIMGDNGSGWWIGRSGLDAGMRAFDGREVYGRASQAMLEVIERDFGDPAGAYMVLQADPHRVQRVASYARVVLDLAEGGDPACLQIADAAALELAISASTGLKLVGETNDPQAATLGGIFNSRELREAFQRYLTELVPGARLVQARGVGLDGAAVLATLDADHPLREKFTEARV